MSKDQFMIISGYTVLESDIKSFGEAIKRLRKYEWISPEPVLVKVICNAKEI